jgi:hypothetical protein
LNQVGKGRINNQLPNAVARATAAAAESAAARLLAREGAAPAEAAALKAVEGATALGHEAHLVRAHVGHTVEDLVKRHTLQKVSVASSFTNIETAAITYRAALADTANTAILNQALSNGALSASIRVTMPEAVGYGVEKAGSVYMAKTAEFIFRRNPYTFPHSWFVETVKLYK